jgi:hypothetical protein
VLVTLRVDLVVRFPANVPSMLPPLFALMRSSFEHDTPPMLNVDVGLHGSADGQH